MTEIDPMFAAVARARAAEKAFDTKWKAEDFSFDRDLADARAALAATVATTPAGLATLTGFLRRMTRELDDAYFQGEDAVAFAASLDTAVRRIADRP